MLASEENITVLDGIAPIFTGNHTIDMQTPDGQTLFLKGERIFINTGATPTIPDIPGLKNKSISHEFYPSNGAACLPRELLGLSVAVICPEICKYVHFLWFTRHGSGSPSDFTTT